MIKIAISGKANSGKNTITNMLVKELSVNSVRINAFADSIKQMCEKMIPNINNTCLFGPSELRQNIISNDFLDADGNPLTYRRLLTDIGKLGRTYNKDLWIKKVSEDIDKHKNAVEAYIITDLRFVNEKKFLTDNEFITIRVKRNDSLKSDDISEIQQDQILDEEFDYIIDNNCSLANLEEKVILIAKSIKNR